MAKTAKRVLVVDDDAGIRDVVTLLLEDEGYEVATARDGAEALEHLEGEGGAGGGAAVDAIVLDYTMPRCDGEEFSRRYRSLPGEKAPIILLTASHELRARCHRVDAAGCVGKPFDAGALLEAVEAQTHTHAA